MQTDCLKGGTIGLICPSHVAGDDYKQICLGIRAGGFRVKLGANLHKRTYGFIASEQERADDLNTMVADEAVDMILFGGGWGANEILPLIDYENIRQHPKLFSSYSDGTSILNAIYAKTGLITYYGLGAGEFRALTYYDYTQFAAHFLEGQKSDGLYGCGRWKTICSGLCQGTLIGGYTMNFGWLLGGAYFSYAYDKTYILFIEDHEKYSEPVAVSAYLSHIEQSPFIRQVSGLVFGHYSDAVPEDLLNRLARFGSKHEVPVVYTDDFGHDTKHSILPIGAPARLDADAQTLSFLL
jgi:muramoyltetrapeptide carboxypeptidase